MLRWRILVNVSLCALLGATLAAQETHAPARSIPAFDQLKSLAGEWDGNSNEGPVKAIYSVVSNGSAVMEHMAPGTSHEMITMYTLEGDRIVVTHYCSAGNQPTMQTASSPAANGKYDFSFVRLSGAKTPDEPHMTGLSISMPDKQHLAETWTYDDHGKSLVHTISYTRVK
jgi:hypothetical protein